MPVLGTSLLCTEVKTQTTVRPQYNGLCCNLGRRDIFLSFLHVFLFLFLVYANFLTLIY